MFASDLLFFIIDINNTVYSRFTFPFIRKYCDKYKYSLFVLKDKLNPQVHPAWYKLLCHNICESPFILCCDLDIFIMPSTPPIHEIIQQDKINICKDACAENGKTLLINEFPFFKYNTGLMGIPKVAQSFVENIYHKNAITGNWPCWEQMYVNEALINVDINVLPNEWNYMVCFYKKGQLPSAKDGYFKHLTPGESYKLMDRCVWAKNHFDYYN